MAVIECKNVVLSYENTVVARNLSFTVNEGDFLCIVGENGKAWLTMSGVPSNTTIEDGHWSIAAATDLEPNTPGSYQSGMRACHRVQTTKHLRLA